MTWIPACVLSNLLTALIFFPLAGALLLFFLPKGKKHDEEGRFTFTPGRLM